MIHYLTVQDVLWINHEVLKEVVPFKFAQLEEAVSFQYGYARSEDILARAGTFLDGFMKLRPFEKGNKGTALVSVLTFLQINGYELILPPEEAANWALEVSHKQKSGAEAVKYAAVRTGIPVALKPAIRTEVHVVLDRYRTAVEELAD